METLKLSKEEIAIIKEKRANDINEREDKAIQSAKNTIAEYIAQSNRMADMYKKHLDMLNKASMSKGCGVILFELVTEVINDEEVPYFYGEGLEKTELKAIKYSTTRCTIKYKGDSVKHELCYVDEDGDTMKYYGDTPEEDKAFRTNAEYTVDVYEHTTGYGYSKNNHGFKMKINGLVYCPNERRDVGQKLTNPKTVLSKIQDDIQLRKDIMEREEYNNSLEARVTSMVELAFPKAKVSIYDRKVTARFENGASIEMRYYDNEEEGIELVTSKVSAPSKSNPIEIGKFLEKM